MDERPPVPDGSILRVTEDWLRDRCNKWSVTLAARASLRMLPLLAPATKHADPWQNILATFRVCAATWLVAIDPDDDQVVAAARTAKEALEATIDQFGRNGLETAVTDAALHAAEATESSHPASVASAVAFAAANSFAGDADRVAFATDAIALETCDVSPSLLGRRRIWPSWYRKGDRRDLSDHVINLQERWYDLRSPLEARQGERWEVWTSWYQGRLDGDKQAPIDISLEKRRVLIPNEDWNNGPAHVNALIDNLSCG
ncbi:MAG: hypothetical protein AAGG47_11755 [Pseudomonadota bacterium]